MTEYTIDYSPNPLAKDMTIVLYNTDLKQAKISQIERFMRVWISDRHLYAPCLNSLTIDLREDGYDIQGIQKFLEYYDNAPKGRQATTIKWSQQ